MSLTVFTSKSGFPSRYGYEMDLQGARVVVTREPVCSYCVTEAEVDYQIDSIIQNLEKVRRGMKKAVREEYPKIPLY
jgi:hypothetical protein